MVDKQTEPLSYSLVQGMDEMLTYTWKDKFELNKKKQSEFIEIFKNQYFDDTQRMKLSRVREKQLKE